MKSVRLEDFRAKYKKEIQEFNTPLFSRVCTNCSNLTKPGERKCSAFPDGIPLEIWNGENDHTKPYKNDNGIQFEKIEFKQVA